MRLSEREDALFSRWRPHRPRFVADGVADEDSYVLSPRRLLFVLKEVNDPEGGNWDLRQFLREGGRSYTWNNITRWVEGIRNLPSDLPWSEVEAVDHDRRLRTLRSIAAINLKKSPGFHTTDVGQLAIVASEDKTFLSEQVALYESDLVICCGVSDTFHWLVDLGAAPAWKRTSRGVSFHEYRPGRFVVSYVHPEARVADNLLYYGLIDAVREIAYQPYHTADVPASAVLPLRPGRG